MADFLVFVTVQPSAKPQQMMHRNGKKNAVSRRTTRDFRKNSENTSRNTSWLNCYWFFQNVRFFFTFLQKSAIVRLETGYCGRGSSKGDDAVAQTCR